MADVAENNFDILSYICNDINLDQDNVQRSPLLSSASSTSESFTLEELIQDCHGHSPPEQDLQSQSPPQELQELQIQNSPKELSLQLSDEEINQILQTEILDPPQDLGGLKNDILANLDHIELSIFEEEPQDQIGNLSTGEKRKICLVCAGEISNKDHNYYGARDCCIGCRGFFRRSVNSGQYRIFECLTGKLKCKPAKDSNSKTRVCKFCRFRRCLKAGMKISWVLNREERKNRVLNQISKVKTKSVKVRRVQELEMGFTIEERKLILEQFNQMMALSNEKYYKFNCNNPEIFLEFLGDPNVYKKPIPAKSYMAYCELDKREMVDFCFSLDDMNQFKPYDRFQLIQKNVDIMMTVFWSGIFITNDDWQDWIQCLGNEIRAKKHVDYKAKQLIQVLEERDMMINEEIILKRNMENENDLLFDMMGWKEDDECKRKAKEVCTFCATWTRDTEDGPQDFLLWMLLFFFILFDPCSKMEEISKAEGLRLRYLSMLQRYLKGKYGCESPMYYRKLNGALHLSPKIQEIPNYLDDIMGKLKTMAVVG